ncbi:MAG: hypothetical protein ABIV50_07595 [Opitutus sp.]
MPSLLNSIPQSQPRPSARPRKLVLDRLPPASASPLRFCALLALTRSDAMTSLKRHALTRRFKVTLIGSLPMSQAESPAHPPKANPELDAR